MIGEKDQKNRYGGKEQQDAGDEILKHPFFKELDPTQILQIEQKEYVPSFKPDISKIGITKRFYQEEGESMENTVIDDKEKEQARLFD